MNHIASKQDYPKLSLVKLTGTADSGQLRIKQITSIICFLRDQLPHQLGHIVKPSKWMIKQLVANAVAHSSSLSENMPGSEKSPNWTDEIESILKTVAEHCNVGLDKTCNFQLIDQGKSLFPNAEHFDEWDAYRFSQALLHYLDKEFSLTA